MYLYLVIKQQMGVLPLTCRVLFFTWSRLAQNDFPYLGSLCSQFAWFDGAVRLKTEILQVVTKKN